MTAFRKDILTLADGDTFHIPGKSSPVKLDPSRIKKWVDNFNKMRKSGVRVPAPWVHDDQILGGKATPIEEKSLSMGNTFMNDGSRNAGFWEQLSFDESSKTLYGVLEVPGNPDDPNTPAGKIGTSVQEVSVYVSPGWKDGSGETWDESILHIGCVCSPIERGQRNFELAENDLYVCMSMQEQQETPEQESAEHSPEKTTEQQGLFSGNLASILGLLKSAVNIALPTSTTVENFLDRLETALAQYQACNEDGEQAGTDVTVPPEGAVEKQAPFIMSFSNEQLAAIVAAGVQNPATGKPWSLPEIQEAARVEPKVDGSVIMAHPEVKAMADSTMALLTAFTDQAKANYRSRIDALKASGGVSPEYATGTLLPMVDSLTMSFENGKPKQQNIDIALSALEANNAGRLFGVQNSGPQAAYANFIAMSQGVPAAASTVDIPGSLLNRPGTEVQESPEQVAERIKGWKSRGIL
jgi:hypothetical protein